MKRRTYSVIGALLVPAIWILAKSWIGVGDRYLPSLPDVARAYKDISPSIWQHLAATSTRLAVGFGLGIIAGIALALAVARSTSLRAILWPSIQSMRAVPAAALVPFMLLWFGFAETGKYLLIVCAVSFNLAVAGEQILSRLPDSTRAFILSFDLTPRSLTWVLYLPRILEDILPTLRFSLAMAIGAVTVAELLGSQVGLGYLIQTSRSTFSLHVLVLATIMLGLLSIVADRLLIYSWRRLVFWRRL